MGYTQNKNYIDKKDLEHFWVAEAINTKQDKALSNEVAEALSGDGAEVRTLDDALLRLNEKAGTGGGGEPGFSPTVEVTKTGKVTTVTITDKTGVHTATINDGADGQPGTNGQDGAKGDKGEDGVSPTISAVRVSNGVQLTITDKNGSHSAVLNDGIGDGISVATFADVPNDGKSYLRQNGTWVEGATKAELNAIGSKVGELDSKVVESSDKGIGDLDVSDEKGNVILRLKNGHVITMNFNSADIVKREEVLKDIADAIKSLPFGDGETKADFSIEDENGNVIAEFNNGHFRVKNFDSRDFNKNTPYLGENETRPDFAIEDENGNVVLALIGGHIVTKNFNSQKTASKDFQDYRRDTIGGADLEYKASDSDAAIYDTIAHILQSSPYADIIFCANFYAGRNHSKDAKRRAYKGELKAFCDFFSLGFIDLSDSGIRRPLVSWSEANDPFTYDGTHAYREAGAERLYRIVYGYLFNRYGDSLSTKNILILGDSSCVENPSTGDKTTWSKKIKEKVGNNVIIKAVGGSGFRYNSQGEIDTNNVMAQYDRDVRATKDIIIITSGGNELNRFQLDYASTISYLFNKNI